jgi:hypothetical protein
MTLYDLGFKKSEYYPEKEVNITKHDLPSIKDKLSGQVKLKTFDTKYDLFKSNFISKQTNAKLIKLSNKF